MSKSKLAFSHVDEAVTLDPDDVRKKGVIKHRPRGKKDWVDRWLVLTTSDIRIYENSKSDLPKQLISLSKVQRAGITGKVDGQFDVWLTSVKRRASLSPPSSRRVSRSISLSEVELEDVEVFKASTQALAIEWSSAITNARIASVITELALEDARLTRHRSSSSIVVAQEAGSASPALTKALNKAGVRTPSNSFSALPGSTPPPGISQRRLSKTRPRRTSASSVKKTPASPPPPPVGGTISSVSSSSTNSSTPSAVIVQFGSVRVLSDEAAVSAGLMGTVRHFSFSGKPSMTSEGAAKPPAFVQWIMDQKSNGTGSLINELPDKPLPPAAGRPLPPTRDKSVASLGAFNEEELKQLLAFLDARMEAELAEATKKYNWMMERVTEQLRARGEAV